MLCQAAGPGMTFYNTSRFVFQPTEAAQGKKYVSLLSDQEQIAANLTNFIAGFSANAREIFLDKFDFGDQIDRLDEGNLLYLVIGKFAEIDLHPDVVSNIEMGYIYEELIRRFSELSNETAGEHFTPREVIRLMVNLLFIDDDDDAHQAGIVRTLCDPAAGPAGCCPWPRTICAQLNPQARLEVFGQELNPETYAVCRSDMMIKGQDALAHRVRQLVLRGRLRRRDVRLPPRQSAVRRRVEEGREGDQGRAREAKGFGGPVRCRAPADQRRLVPLPPAHDLEDEARRRRAAPGSRSSSTARRCSPGPPVRGERDPAVDHRERLAGSRRRPARPALLQHGHLHLLLGRHQPQGTGAPRQGSAGRCPRVLRQDAQDARREAQGDRGRLKRQARPDRRESDAHFANEIGNAGIKTQTDNIKETVFKGDFTVFGKRSNILNPVTTKILKMWRRS